MMFIIIPFVIPCFSFESGVSAFEEVSYVMRKPVKIRSTFIAIATYSVLFLFIIELNMHPFKGAV